MNQTTKKKIIKTASDLLWRDGYEGASLNNVVKQAGVSKGAFFHYYPSKQAITVEILGTYAQEHILGPLEKHLADSHDPKTGLFAWLEESFGAYSQWDYKGGCMLGNFALELSDKDEALREQMKSIFLAWENILVNALRAPAKDGKLMMEPRQFARLIISTYQGVLLTIKVHKDHNRASRDFQALAELIERMIRG